MLKPLALATILLVAASSYCQKASEKSKRFKGMYFQWGYNKEWYTKSNLRFSLSNGDKFTVHKVKAHDSPDLDAIINVPTQISIPQYSYRIGFYLNKTKTKAIELNFDHIKYIATDYQTARVSGVYNGKIIDEQKLLDPQNFLHLEHTDGGNLMHINYVQIHHLLEKKATTKPLLNAIWKVGAGFNIPRTDVTWKGEQFNNQFHIAGYNISAEAGARYYFLKNIFFETTAKTGFVHYVNALANTAANKGNKVEHHFGYFELIGTVGFDINW